MSLYFAEPRREASGTSAFSHVKSGTFQKKHFLLLYPFSKSLFKFLKGGVLSHGTDNRKMEMKDIKTMDCAL